MGWLQAAAGLVIAVGVVAGALAVPGLFRRLGGRGGGDRS
jgi:hypothetical protein